MRTNVFRTKLGDITIVGPLGEGGNGLVYEGELFGRPVAIKFLVATESHKLMRFKAEFFNILSLPENPFVARPLLYDELQVENQTFPAIVLPRYAGSLERTDTPSKEVLANLTEFLLNAVNFIHSHGIVHRDLKPENILVNGDNYLLADFGIANYNPEMFGIMADTRSN